jgi:hypothetical protein
MKHYGLLLSAAVLLLASTCAYGKPGGVLRGVVVSAQGVPVSSAQVFCQTADGKAPRTVRTDLAGQFQFVALPEGLYDLRAQASGRWSGWEHNVVVRQSKEARATLRLLRSGPPPPGARKNK